MGKCSWDEVAACVDIPAWISPGNYYIFYYSFMRPSFRSFYFDDENTYRAEVIDTWNMTIEDKGTFKGHFDVQLPGREYMAIRITKVNS